MFVYKKRHFELSFLRHSERSEESKNINFFGIAENKAATLGSFGHKGLRMTMKECLGRSMIEMLGVLAIVGVLSIGGIALYRRAVNHHQANSILDDVNRLAFVITEKGGYPEGEDIPKGDFRESGIYTLTGHQAYSGQYSITALNVPKGICEILIDKGIIDYKVGVVTAGGSVENEILYDTLHTDICTNNLNDIAFYFGDTSGVCNGDESTPADCTVNADCCGKYFCAFENATSGKDKGDGKCQKINDSDLQSVTITIDGVSQTWIRSTTDMTWWSVESFCQTNGKRMATREDIKYQSEAPHSIVWTLLYNAGWRGYFAHWLNSTGVGFGCPSGFQQTDSVGNLDCYGRQYKKRALCL